MRLAICDDEIVCLQEYKQKFSALLGELGVHADIALYSDCHQLMDALRDPFCEEIDTLFLDINMPGINGIEMAQWLRDNGYSFEIIFLTVSQTHMLNAFDVGAFHYIVKGVTEPEKMRDICLRAIEAANQRKREVITVACAGESRIIVIQDILYFEVLNYIVIVHYGNETFEFYSTLGKIENSLMSHGFVRVHKSYLVNIQHIQSFTQRELRLQDGTCIPIGRKYADTLRQVFRKQGDALS